MKKIVLSALFGFVAIGASAQQQKYGPNILRLYPISVFEFGGVGAGIGYERIFTDDGKFGLKIPFQFGVSNNYSSNSSSKLRLSGMFNPGIKFYPAGQRKVSYAIGASLFTAFGSYEGDWVYNSQVGSYQYSDGSHTRAGFLIDNYVQFNISPKINFGMEFSIGPSYLNRIRISRGEKYGEGIQAMSNFGFHIGVRF